MSNKVVNSIQNFERDRCADIFVRADGTFGFEEYRRDPEDGGRWNPITRMLEENALTQAKTCVPWLATDAMS